MASEPTVRVEVGAADAEFTPTDVSEILAGLDLAQRRADDLRGVVYRLKPSPMETLAGLLREAVRDLPVPERCTGYWDDLGLIAHDGDSCPLHELED